jgi:hypothetical protein
MYKAVAFKPFNVEETPLFSKITAIRGRSIPCEKPEIATMPTNIQN